MENPLIVDDLALTKKSTFEGFQCVALKNTHLIVLEEVVKRWPIHGLGVEIEGGQLCGDVQLVAGFLQKGFHQRHQEGIMLVLLLTLPSQRFADYSGQPGRQIMLRNHYEKVRCEFLNLETLTPISPFGFDNKRP